MNIYPVYIESTTLFHIKLIGFINSAKQTFTAIFHKLTFNNKKKSVHSLSHPYIVMQKITNDRRTNLLLEITELIYYNILLVVIMNHQSHYNMHDHCNVNIKRGRPISHIILYKCYGRQYTKLC